MKGPLARRLAHARDKTPAVRDPSTMTPAEKREYAFSLLDGNAQVGLMNARFRRQRDAEAARQEPAPAPTVEPAPAPVEPEPSPKRSRPRHPWEPDPNYAPPTQNEYWKERCRFRVRRPDEPYVDAEPPEQNDDDALIFGT
jgi:hypothetical protein